ncbi:MAG: exosortase A [Gammaproteobacteria bacterium]|nr:exosortase A [Gammaproteobacteria bacterium]
MGPGFARAWSRRLALLVGAVLAVVALLAPTFDQMANIWLTSSTFNHCLLVPPISLYLVWLKRGELAHVRPGVAPLGALYAGLNALLWVAGTLVSIAFVQQVAAVGILIGTIWTLLGNAAARLLLFPLAYLYFGVPEGEFLVPYLQDWTAQVLVVLLRFAGMPVFLEGRMLSIPSGDWVVEEACSGINYLLATLAIGSVYCYLGFRSAGRRAAFMALAVAVPLVANGMRAFGIVMIAHYSKYRYAVGLDHFIYGWVFFGVVIFLLFLIGNSFSDADAPVPPHAPGRAPGRPRALAPWAVAVLALAATPRFAVSILEHAPAATALTALPQVAGWEGPSAGMLPFGARFVGEPTILTGRYSTPGMPDVWLQIAHYREQRPGADLASQVNTFFDPKRWHALDEQRLTLEAPLGPAISRRLRGPSSEWMSWQWFEVDGTLTTRRLDVKIREGLARLLRSRDGAAHVVLAAPIGASAQAAEEAIAAFAAAARPRLASLHAAPAEPGR